RFFDRLTMDLGYTYLNTELEAISLPPLPPDSPFLRVIPTAQVGTELSFSPKNRVTVTGTYKVPVDESVGDVSLGLTFVHTDAQNATSAVVSPLFRLPATNLLNFNFDWKNVTGLPVDFSVFATNLANEIYPVAVGSSFISAGFENVLFGAPRMYGMR